MDNLNTEALRAIPLFSNIAQEDMEPMLGCLGIWVRAYKKGACLIMDGDVLRSIGVVLSGTVHILKEDIWGGQSLYAVVQQKGVFGETIVCGSLDSSTVSFYAAADCEILFLPFDRVLHTCSKACAFHYQLIENMVFLLASKNAMLMEKLEITSKKNLRERILAYLSQQAEKSGSMYIVSPMGRMALADYLCADRSALTRELARMKAEGILDYDKNTFRLIKKGRRGGAPV